MIAGSVISQTLSFFCIFPSLSTVKSLATLIDISPLYLTAVPMLSQELILFTLIGKNVPLSPWIFASNFASSLRESNSSLKKFPLTFPKNTTLQGISTCLSSVNSSSYLFDDLFSEQRKFCLSSFSCDSNSLLSWLVSAITFSSLLEYTSLGFFWKC